MKAFKVRWLLMLSCLLLPHTAWTQAATPSPGRRGYRVSAPGRHGARRHAANCGSAGSPEGPEQIPIFDSIRPGPSHYRMIGRSERREVSRSILRDHA